MKSYDHAACQAVVQPFKKSVKETQRSVSNPPFPSPTFSFQNIHAHTNKVRFRNQISTLPQPNFDDSATKIRYASATKKRRFRNQKKRFRNQKRTIPQPKQDDSATKNRRFRNQNPRDSETKIRVTLQPRSVLLHSAWHRLQVPHSTWHRLQMQWGRLG